MSVMTDAGRRGFALVERLLGALTDPARRERTALAVVLGYVAVWTLYGVLAKASQDIHIDMSEQFALARELAWGYGKHPPLAMLIVRAWFTIFPSADWSYYLLAMANSGLALWLAWRLSARFLDGDKRVLGLALLTLVPFFNFHALKFNSNTVLMPLWAATTLLFLRSFETRRVFDAALAGLAAAAAMYGKYWSIFLLAGLAVAALADPRRSDYFRSPAPWVTTAVGALALVPHVAWLVTNDFAPFSYAVTVHGAASYATTLRSTFGYLAGSAAYVAAPLLIVFLVARPGVTAIWDMAWPPVAPDPRRRFAALTFWLPLLLPAVLALVAGVGLVSLWSMSAWALLPVMLLSSPLIAISRRDVLRVLTLALAFPLVMLALAPAIAFAIHRAGPEPGAAHSSVLVEPVERLWRETTDRPLRLFAGFDEFTDGVAFYMRGHPVAAHVLDGGLSPAFAQRIARDGIAMVCPERPHHLPSAQWCLTAANGIAARFGEGKRLDITLARRYLGVEGKPARYTIITVPPR
jgi:4-amino-4-deoxy-L-arabinose transferase-like glycosyltransferase